MAGERTPTDELTGLPLLLVPTAGAEYFLEHPAYNARQHLAGKNYADWNHAYHPRKELVGGDESAQAVRDCRGQLVLRNHHSAYHIAFEGPPLPQTREERLRAVVFSLAGLIPRQAIDLRRTSPRIVTLNTSQMERLHNREARVVRPMNPKSLQKFLLGQVLEPPKLETVPRRLLGAFMNTETDTLDGRKTREQLTYEILSLAIEPLTEPMRQAYHATLAENLWPRDSYSSPRDTVHRHLIGPIGDFGYVRKKNVWRIGAMLGDTLVKYPELARAS